MEAMSNRSLQEFNPLNKRIKMLNTIERTLLFIKHDDLLVVICSTSKFCSVTFLIFSTSEVFTSFKVFSDFKLWNSWTNPFRKHSSSHERRVRLYVRQAHKTKHRINTCCPSQKTITRYVALEIMTPTPNLATKYDEERITFLDSSFPTEA